MALDLTPVHRNLHQRVRFLYLEFEDLFLILGLAALLNVAGRFLDREISGIPLNIVLQYVVPILAVPCLMLFKYGKPRGYLQDLVMWRVKPHIYCGLEADQEQTREYFD